jgi:hypothetical protein
MRSGTVIGGFVWTVLVAGSASDLFRLGLIELLFLLAPLVVVPLGLDLAERLSMGRSDCTASSSRAGCVFRRHFVWPSPSGWHRASAL